MSTGAHRRTWLTLAISGCLGLWACGAPGSAAPERPSIPSPTPLAIAGESTGALPTPKPSGKPSTTAKPAGRLTVKFDPIAPVSRGDDASATVYTDAGASCNLVVRLKSGPSKAKGLGAAQADGSGVATWSWHVALNTTRGSWPATATCTSGGATASAKTYLVVR